MRYAPLFALVALVLVFAASPVFAAPEARAISYPAISADGASLYFTTWGDVWTAPTDGSSPARRLTDNPAYEGRALPSPDGKSLAFISDRYGSYDIFVMPIGGSGDWQRLTWGGHTDYLYDWRPDSQAVLGYAMRQDSWGEALYEFPLDGGPARRVSGPNDHDEAVFGTYAGADGQRVVYARGPGDWSRQRHHGSDCYDIFLLDRTSGEHRQLTNYNGNDLWPQAAPDGQSCYFVSDRSGCRNIFKLQLQLPLQEPTQLTSFKGQGPVWPRLSPDGDQLVYEISGELWLQDLPAGSARKVPVFFSDDPKGEMRLETDFQGGIDEYALSPNGRYFALGVYGDLFILKNEDAYPPQARPDQDLSLARRIVDSPGREMQMAWSPDSLELAYVSDRDGSFDVYVYDLRTQTERKLRSTPSTEEWMPKFAPKGRRLAYYSGNRKLMLYDLNKHTETMLVEGQLKHGPYQLGFEWSPDGNWLAFSKANVDYYSELFLINIQDKKPINISVNSRFNASAAWSPDGKWLAYTDYEPGHVQLVLLELNPEPETYDLDLLFPEDRQQPQAGPPAPGIPPAAAAAAEQATPAGEASPAAPAEPGPDAAAAAPPAPTEPEAAPMTIDLRRIHLRGETITGMAGNAASPGFDPTSSYLIFEMLPAGAEDSEEPQSTWWSLTLKDRQFSQLTQGPGNMAPQFMPDGSKIFFRNEQTKQLGFLAMQGPVAVGGGPRPTSCPVSLDQYVVWDQMLCEGWRHLRDSFYRPIHELGLDWEAVLERYRPRVRFCGTTQEFNSLYREMLGELGGSHLGFYGGGPTSEAPPETSGDLGVWFDEHYSGPGLRVSKVFLDGPADQPGSSLQAGDILLQLDGTELGPEVNLDRLLRNRVGRPLKLKLRSAPPGGSGGELPGTADTPAAEREVLIKPTSLGAMRQLVYRQWVEDNKQAVAEASGGKVGYLHILSMDQASLQQFRRELFAENYDKPGLIIDVRFNQGGNISEQLFNLFDQRVFATQAHRDSHRTRQPALSYQGKVAILINPHSYSDGEIFPHIMQQMGLAKLVGEATGGNVIGTYDFPLLDGSLLRLPSWGWWLNDGTDMEGSGAQPDLPVVYDPQLGAVGRDNQLEEAISFMLKELS